VFGIELGRLERVAETLWLAAERRSVGRREDSASMTLQDLGNLGDFIAAIAVIVSLVYLARQIRQNTLQLQNNAKAASLAALEASAQSGHQYREVFIKDPEVAALYLKGLRGDSGLTPEERLRFGMLMDSFVRLLQTVFTRSEIYGLNPGGFRHQEATLVSVLGRPGAAQWWLRNRRNFTPEFVARVEKLVAAGSSTLTGPVDPLQESR
jgi:hypothetical protein